MSASRSESRTSKMGRNPFQKKEAAKTAIQTGKLASTAEVQSKPSTAMARESKAPESRVSSNSSTSATMAPLDRLCHWVFVDLRAELYLLKLKTVLLAKEVIG